MLSKNKTKEQLISELYTETARSEKLSECVSKQGEILKRISDAMDIRRGLIKTASKSRKSRLFLTLFNYLIILFNFLVIPFRIYGILSQSKEYFFTFKIKRMKLTEEKIIEALGKIADFEKKEISVKEYVAYISELLGLKDLCDTCGDVTNRLHNDFQKRISSTIQEQAPHLLKPIKLQSGKYAGEYWTKAIPTLTYSGLYLLRKAMNKDVTLFFQRGLKDQSKLVSADCETMEIYISEKLGNTGDENPEAEPSINADKEPKIEPTVKAEGTEKKTYPEYSDEVVETLRAADTTFKDIGIYFGVSDSTIRSRFAKYNAAKEDSKKEDGGE